MVGEGLGGESRRQRIEDFVARYDSSPPEAGISDDEARRYHDELTSVLPDEEYREAATEAFGRMSSEQRREVGKRLRAEATARGVAVDESDDEDAGVLGAVATALRAKQSGGLGRILGDGGSSGGVLYSSAERAALAGIAVHVAKRFLKR